MMKLRKHRKRLYRRALIGIRIRQLLATLDALAEEVLHSETELIAMELPRASKDRSQKPLQA